MKKILIAILFCLFSFSSFGQNSEERIHIVPEPVSVVTHEGYFHLPEYVTLVVPENEKLETAAQLFKQQLATTTGAKVAVKHQLVPGTTIVFELNETANKDLGEEGYQLLVHPNDIVVKANQPAGLFYGMQSLIQLFPKEIEGHQLAEGIDWKVPLVEIKDYPRFGWRGLMFDVARHFFTKEEVKQFIDEMVKYKFNLLHLHLTDDQGWRIEIKGLPKLTEVGAWNVKKVGYFGTFSKPDADAPRNYGGFYTQEDIKELVQYAKDRFVDILPEIDVPAHSLAAVAAYPELSCTAAAVNYQVNSGEQFMDWSQGAPPIALVDNTLCPANEEVYDFLDKVFTQVAQLFPFEYIHVGGDEAPQNFWEKSPEIKKLMEKEDLADMHDVQAYFTKRVNKIITSKGKKMIGWDEILQGGDLPKEAAVMSWRGMKGGIKAAKSGHKVVMSPTTYAYLDYMQGDPIIEPKVYDTLRLSKAYKFDPLPEGVNPKYIMGGQGNLWTEQIYNMRHLEYMLWPRGMAVAEAVWSPESKRSWPDFFNRVEYQFKRLHEAGIKYAPSVYDPIFKATETKDHKLSIELATEVKDLDIYYSFDNSYPDQYYPKYEHPLTPPEDAVMLKVITYEGNKKMGRMISMQIKELKKRAEME